MTARAAMSLVPVLPGESNAAVAQVFPSTLCRRSTAGSMISVLPKEEAKWCGDQDRGNDVSRVAHVKKQGAGGVPCAWPSRWTLKSGTAIAKAT